MLKGLMMLTILDRSPGLPTGVLNLPLLKKKGLPGPGLPGTYLRSRKYQAWVDGQPYLGDSTTI